MKKLLLTLTSIALVGTASADIQDPPMNDQGPTRKFSRAISNILFGASELPETMRQVNEREGNAAAWSYGIIKGSNRVLVRLGAGIYEFVTFPFPTTRGSFRPPYKTSVPWIHGGFDEFPPELGWQARKGYNTVKYGYGN